MVPCFQKQFLSQLRNLYLNSLRLLLRTLGKVNPKHTILIVSPDIVLIDGGRHTKGPEEFAPGAFPPVLCRTRLRSLSSYGKAIVVHTDIERCTIYAGKINCHRVFTVVLVNVRRRIPIRAFNFIALVGLVCSPMRSVFK